VLVAISWNLFNLVVVLYLAVFVVRRLLGVETNKALPDPVVLVVAAYLLFGLGSLVGLGLAVAGLVERNTKKLFPILGLALNAPIFVYLVVALASYLPYLGHR
jgi:hypothetical protein